SQIGISLFSNDGPSPADAMPTSPVPLGTAPVPQVGSQSSAPADLVPDAQRPVAAIEEQPSVTSEAVAPIGDAKESPQPESTPAEVLFAAVRTAIQRLLIAPMKDAEVAAALDVSSAQAKAWLQRLIDEGVVEKQKKPAGYVVKQNRLFE
ncbi:MAG TPA: DNA protecting protein DprA, partial [Cupriavidus sp.]|nr:DNA protecting protein DprA [Cupriavidus sp.]